MRSLSLPFVLCAPPSQAVSHKVRHGGRRLRLGGALGFGAQTGLNPATISNRQHSSSNDPVANAVHDCRGCPAGGAQSAEKSLGLCSLRASAERTSLSLVVRSFRESSCEVREVAVRAVADWSRPVRTGGFR